MVFVRHKKTITFFFVSLLVIVLLIAIFVITYFPNTIVNKSENPELNQLINKVIELKDNEKIASNRHYPETVKILESLKKEKLSEQIQYKAFESAAVELELLYSFTNDSKIRTIFSKDMDEYAKKHYPKYYDKELFDYPCQDPSCAPGETPEKLSLILSHIEQSDFPENIKEAISHDLINASYRSEQDEHFEFGKVQQYLLVARSIRSLSDFTKTEANVKVYQEIVDFIKSDYPNTYEFLQKFNSELLK